MKNLDIDKAIELMSKGIMPEVICDELNNTKETLEEKKLIIDIYFSNYALLNINN